MTITEAGFHLNPQDRRLIGLCTDEVHFGLGDAFDLSKLAFNALQSEMANGSTENTERLKRITDCTIGVLRAHGAIERTEQRGI